MAKLYDTIVIGLGAAGATAASTLARAGRRVLALEAQDRVGGRVKTVPFGDGVVEEGAEWIHGTASNRVYEIAVQNKVRLLDQILSFGVFQSDGCLGDCDLVNELIDFSFTVSDEPPENPEPLGQYVTRRLNEYLKENHPKVLQDGDFLAGFLDMMDLLFNNYNSSNHWDDLSTHSCYHALDGHQHVSWHRNGYNTFFEILLNTYNNGPGLPSLDIKLNKEVTLIKWPRDSAGPVQVTCRDGDHYTANNVIVTVSLGVLKERHSQMFSPELSEEKIEAIKNIPIGVMDKIIFKFDKPWWPTTTSFHTFLWRGVDRKGVRKEDYWTTRIFACSTPKGSGNALTLWTSGDVAKMVETLPEDIVTEKCMGLLRRFMGRTCTIPEPTGMIRSTWYSNPYTRGSYSYDDTAAPRRPAARAALAEPLADAAGGPRVLFAGEATDGAHFSTVHGASASGDREARRLLPSSKI